MRLSYCRLVGTMGSFYRNNKLDLSENKINNYIKMANNNDQFFRNKSITY